MLDARWSEVVAVGSLAFVDKVKSELGAKALHREPEQVDGSYELVKLTRPNLTSKMGL